MSEAQRDGESVRVPSDGEVAIRSLHAPRYDGYIHAEVCDHCSDDEDGRWTRWPCPTIKVLDEHSGKGRRLG